MSKKKYFEKFKKKTEYLMKKQSIWWQKSVFYDKNPLGIGENPHHPYENRKIRVKLEREMQTRVRKLAASTGSFPIEPDQ